MGNVSSRIWKFTKHKFTDRLTLLALAEFANDDSVCFSGPSFTELGDMIGVNRRSAIRVVEKLAESGELFYKPTVGRGNTNLYFITAGLTTGEVKQILTSTFEMADSEAQEVIDSLLQKGVIYDINGVTGDTIRPKEMVLPVTQSPENGVTGDINGVMGDVKGVTGDTQMIIDNNNEKTIKEFWYVYQNEIGGISSNIQQRIDGYVTECPIAWMIEAVNICVENNVRKPVYLFSVIENAIAHKLPPRLAWDKKKGKRPASRQESRPESSPLPPTPDLPPPVPIPKWAELWQQAAGILRGQMTQATFEQVIGHLVACPNHNGTFILAAPPGVCEQVRRIDKKILFAIQQFKPEIKSLEVITQ